MIEPNDELMRAGLASICSTMNYYEKNQVSPNRTPVIGDRECCSTPEQYIECRLNYECFFIPALKEYAKLMDGHLFDVVKVTNFDYKRKKFKECTVTLHKTSETYIGDRNFWEVYEEISSLLGPTKTMKFNWSCKKDKIKIQIL